MLDVGEKDGIKDDGRYYLRKLGKLRDEHVWGEDQEFCFCMQ